MGSRFQKSLRKLHCGSKSPHSPASSGVGEESAGFLRGNTQGLWEDTVDGLCEHVQRNPEATHLFRFMELTVACLLGQRSLRESLPFISWFISRPLLWLRSEPPQNRNLSDRTLACHQGAQSHQHLWSLSLLGMNL